MDSDINIVSWTLSGAHDRPDEPVIIDVHDTRRTLTKRAAVRLIARLEGSFEPDSTVCLHLDNDILYPILTLAINASHCRWTGMNTSYKMPELEHHLRISNAAYVITTLQHLPTIREAANRCGINPEIILFTDLLNQCVDGDLIKETDGAGTHLRTLHDLLKEGDEQTLEAALQGIDPESIAALFSTSGTTGKPKMAARTHKTLVLETQAILDNNGAKDYKVRRLYCTAIFHAFTTPEMMYNSLRLGQEAYFMKRFDLALWPKLIQQYQITEALAPPAVITLLADTKAAHASIQSLRAVFTGGAPLLPDSAERFRAVFDRAPRIVPVWGMTEGGWFATLKYPEEDRAGSVGRPIPGYEIKMTDKHRSKLDDGTVVGEMYVRGPSLMTGYLGNDEESRNAFDQGWLKTGDVGYIRDGKVFLVDRAKDLIKVKGWQVSPAEIESWLDTNPELVQDSGVVGSGYETGEYPVVFVVRKNHAVTPGMIKAHLLRGLTRYKVQNCEIRFIDSVPRSAIGKILRNELRALVHSHSDDRFARLMRFGQLPFAM